MTVPEAATPVPEASPELVVYGTIIVLFVDGYGAAETRAIEVELEVVGAMELTAGTEVVTATLVEV